MQRISVFFSLCAAVIFAPVTAALSAQDDLSAFTSKQLDTAITNSGLAQQKIYAIHTFDIGERPGANIAILSSSRSGWQVTVLRHIKAGLEVEWRSGRLPDDFAVSSFNNLEIENIDDGEQVVQFSGCARHMCGGVDGLFGVLLYSPRSKQVFFAHYRWDEGKTIGSFGSVELSENANRPGHERYKRALQNAMNKALGR